MADPSPSYIMVQPQKPGSAGQLLPRHAYFGFRLKSLQPGKNGVASRALLITRLITSHEPGRSRAIELRYVVRPASSTNDWREEIECYLLVRNSDWRHGARPLKQETRRFAAQVSSLLSHNLPGCLFIPLTGDELERALQPFPILDT
jgi:hypothetical protein